MAAATASVQNSSSSRRNASLTEQATKAELYRRIVNRQNQIKTTENEIDVLTSSLVMGHNPNCRQGEQMQLRVRQLNLKLHREQLKELEARLAKLLQTQPEQQQPATAIQQPDFEVIIPEENEWVNLPSQRSIREMHDIRALERVVRHKRKFHDRTIDFINAIRSSLVNSDECRVRRRGGWDNHVSYRITYRQNCGEGRHKTVRVNQEDWSKILQRLRQDKFNVTFLPDSPVVIIQLGLTE